jgi:hypothetical protein
METERLKGWQIVATVLYSTTHAPGVLSGVATGRTPIYVLLYLRTFDLRTIYFERITLNTY